MTGARRTLSLCLIVKDEEAFLADCLRSAAGLVDEIVLIDTGSRDATVAIAEAHGARVGHFAWTGSFADARNASLDAATGDFVLVLDADERLAPETPAILRALIDAEPADAPPTVYLPLIVNVDAEGRPLGADHMPRLWRHRPELRYRGRVHERIGPDVPGLRQVFDDRLRIVHLGYDPELAAARGKRARNRALLHAELAERPGDPLLVYYLAKEHYAAGEDEAALAGFRQVIEEGSAANLALGAAVFVAECLRSLGRPDEALAFAAAAAERTPDYGELWYVAARAALEAGRPDEALRLLPKARRQPVGLAGAAFRDPAIAAWRAELAEAEARLALGDTAGAEAGFVAVLDRLPAPEQLATRLDLSGLALARGDRAAAAAHLEPVLAAAPADATPALLAWLQAEVDHAGLLPAYTDLHAAFRRHPALLHQLPLVGAAVDLAEALGDEDGLFEWLRLCALLDSPHPSHAMALAARLAARGDAEGARAQLARAATLNAEEADR
ncbi:MAG: tetratricopeptide repeat protein [Myxococcales bacterium]|nr:tetratricopeptide repeat protein [Myxococcales bacterium]